MNMDMMIINHTRIELENVSTRKNPALDIKSE